VPATQPRIAGPGDWIIWESWRFVASILQRRIDKEPVDLMLVETGEAQVKIEGAEFFGFRPKSSSSQSVSSWLRLSMSR